MKNIEKNRVVVVGMAKSGLSVAKLLKQKGADVFVTDSKSIEELQGPVHDLQSAGIQFECGKHSLGLLDECDFVVLSPGVPEAIDFVQQTINNHIPFYSEIEIASWFCQSPIVGITGSNGKTTTTSLIGEIVKTVYPGSFVGGNIGTPFSDPIETLNGNGIAVLELSSFQLSNIVSFHPHVSVLLNFSPDHLDRHRTYEFYIDAKRNIFKNQNSNDFIIYNFDDPIAAESANLSAAQKIAFSSKEKTAQLYVADKSLFSRLTGKKVEIISFDELQLQGIHNYMNVAAAVGAAQCLGIGVDFIQTALKRFAPIEHRLEFVRELNGVSYYNDSKATNSDAAKQALSSFDGPIILLASGYAKEHDYSHLADLVFDKVRITCFFGKDREKLCRDLNCKPGKNAFMFENLEGALFFASKIADIGETILLSPMCASFDQYANFEERGKHFKNMVNKLQ